MDERERVWVRAKNNMHKIRDLKDGGGYWGFYKHLVILKHWLLLQTLFIHTFNISYVHLSGGSIYPSRV